MTIQSDEVSSMKIKQILASIGKTSKIIPYYFKNF